MQEVMVNIKGTQHNGRESDCIEYLTVGKYGYKNGRSCIVYDDSASLGVDGVTTTLHIDGSRRVVLQRSGGLQSRLIIEKGQRNLCRYGMAAGSAMIGIFGETIVNELDPGGGHFYMTYTLDINSSLISKNELEISIKEV